MLIRLVVKVVGLLRSIEVRSMEGLFLLDVLPMAFWGKVLLEGVY